MSSSTIFSSLSSKNYKAFLLFLSLTLVLWFVIQMTKTYTYKKEIEVSINDTPKHIAIDSLSQKLEVYIKADGLKLWSLNLSNTSFAVNYNEVEKDSSYLKLKTSIVQKFFSDKFSINLDNVDVNRNVLIYPYNKKKTKEVPVEADIDIEFSPGYNSKDKIITIPKTVKLSGVEEELKAIKSITTEKLSLKGVNDTIKTNISLLKPKGNLELSITGVEIFLPVEKYSENALNVAIEVRNVPDSLDINIFPNKAKVSFLVSLDKYENVSALDFKVICDYNKRFSDKGIFIPELEKYPDYILNPKLNIKKVDYLVKHKS